MVNIVILKSAFSSYIVIQESFKNTDDYKTTGKLHVHVLGQLYNYSGKVTRIWLHEWPSLGFDCILVDTCRLKTL